jgi:hypothetical protein
VQKCQLQASQLAVFSQPARVSEVAKRKQDQQAESKATPSKEATAETVQPQKKQKGTEGVCAFLDDEAMHSGSGSSGDDEDMEDADRNDSQILDPDQSADSDGAKHLFAAG